LKDSMTRQIITPEWLFKQAGLTAAGAAEWKQEIPERGPGVYIITSTDPAADGQPVVYIGRSKHLRRRLKQFYKHQYGQKAPHRGGQEILRLKGSLTVYWAPAEYYAAAERGMLEAFQSATGVWPHGNRMKSAAMAPISD
jgi:hypothetical protein